MTETRWEVSEEDTRGRQRGNQCFYCNGLLGGRHEAECVIPQREVRVRVTFEITRSVPHFWKPSMIDFHMNESSWCMGNIIAELEKLDDQHGCLCAADAVKLEYIGEAEHPRTGGEP